jgi:hypothetical protein
MMRSNILLLLLGLLLLASCKTTKSTAPSTGFTAPTSNQMEPDEVRIIDKPEQPGRDLGMPKEDFDKLSGLAKEKATLECTKRGYEKSLADGSAENPSAIQDLINRTKLLIGNVDEKVARFYPDPTRKALFESEYNKHLTELCPE